MILVDTGPLVAICDPRDSRHGSSVTLLARWVARGLCLCDAILAEACFHLPHRMQRERLALVVDTFRIASLPTHEPGFRAEVFRWLRKYADHEPDWADGCVVILCERDPRVRVWSYDGEFRTTWRKPDGKAIPLAASKR